MPIGGRFPLQPGKPLVFRRPNGAWGYSCACGPAGRVTDHGNGARSHAQGSEAYNRDSWAKAWWAADYHARHDHKSRAQWEIEALEAAYGMPSAERTSQ